MSVRSLQRKFGAAMGCTPLEAKFNIQLQRIRQMLSETDLKLDVIAKRSGFRHVSHMSAFFKSQTGMTCGQFRSQSSDSAYSQPHASQAL
jgi:LacI family transcriptional regulator